MADTIVNTPSSRDDSSAAAMMTWLLAAIVIVAVLAAAFLWYRNGAPGVPNTGTEINVELPNAGAVTPGGGSETGM